MIMAVLKSWVCWTWQFGLATPTVQRPAWMEASSSGVMINHWLGTKESCVEKVWACVSPRFNLLPVNVVPSEAQTAAAAAGRAWLKRLLKSECSQKGIVLYQMMLKMLKGKSFSMGLVQKILSYSMPVPKIIDQLDLWERVGDWMATICGRPASVLAAAAGNTADVEDPAGMQDNGEAGALLYIGVLVF